MPLEHILELENIMAECEHFAFFLIVQVCLFQFIQLYLWSAHFWGTCILHMLKILIKYFSLNNKKTLKNMDESYQNNIEWNIKFQKIIYSLKPFL